MISEGTTVVGFTGTRRGMTTHQANDLRCLLLGIKTLADANNHVVEFHHGDCNGSDEEAHDIAHKLGYWIHVHPPTQNRYRAHCIGDCSSAPNDYLLRNRDIVRASHIMIATPAQTEQPSSLRGQGTWWTIECARKYKDKELIIIPPKGLYGT